MFMQKPGYQYNKKKELSNETHGRIKPHFHAQAWLQFWQMTNRKQRRPIFQVETITTCWNIFGFSEAPICAIKWTVSTKDSLLTQLCNIADLRTEVDLTPAYFKTLLDWWLPTM